MNGNGDVLMEGYIVTIQSLKIMVFSTEKC